MNKLLSIIIPAYNSESTIPGFHPMDILQNLLRTESPESYGSYPGHRLPEESVRSVFSLHSHPHYVHTEEISLLFYAI